MICDLCDFSLQYFSHTIADFSVTYTMSVSFGVFGGVDLCDGCFNSLFYISLIEQLNLVMVGSSVVVMLPADECFIWCMFLLEMGF